MKVQFVRSGGFANIPLSAAVDTATMSPQEGSEIERLVAAAGFFDLPPTVGDAGAARDTYQYRVTVTTPERERTVAFSGNLPRGAEELIAFLERAAKARRGGTPAN